MRQGAISTLDGICNTDNKCPDTQQARDAASKGKTFTGLSGIMVPVGVAAAVVGIVLIATSGPQKAKTEKDAGKPAARAPKIDFVGWAPGASVGGASILGSF